MPTYRVRLAHQRNETIEVNAASAGESREKALNAACDFEQPETDWTIARVRKVQDEESTPENY